MPSVTSLTNKDMHSGNKRQLPIELCSSSWLTNLLGSIDMLTMLTTLTMRSSVMV